MAKVLIAYGTTEGQTRKIAQQIADWLKAEGHEASTWDAKQPLQQLDGVDRVIVAGSLHVNKHQSSVKEFVQSHRQALEKLPTAFLSVSLTAQSSLPKDQAAAGRCIDLFLAETHWRPQVAKPVAGALKYREYGWFKRMLMKSICKRNGGDTDTSKNYEYTDWADLKAFVLSFMSTS